MKRFVLFLLIALFCMTGCKSNPQKAESLIKDYLSKQLDDFKSYEPIETRLDTAFCHLMLDKQAFDASMKAWPIYDQILSYTKEMIDAEREMAENDSFFTIGKYNRAVNRFNSYVNKKNQAWKEILPYLQTIRDRSNQLDSTQVLGWIAKHTFRSKNKDGNSSMNDALFFIDPSFSKVISVFSISDLEKFQSVVDLAVDNELIKDINSIP